MLGLRACFTKFTDTALSQGSIGIRLTKRIRHPRQLRTDISLSLAKNLQQILVILKRPLLNMNTVFLLSRVPFLIVASPPEKSLNHDNPLNIS